MVRMLTCRLTGDEKRGYGLRRGGEVREGRREGRKGTCNRKERRSVTDGGEREEPAGEMLPVGVMWSRRH